MQLFNISAVLAALLLANPISGHTWVEAIRHIAADGTFTGPAGYIRNFGPRDGSLGGPDAVNSYSMVNPTDKTPMCKSNQIFGQQSPNYPAPTAAPGDNIALQYLENGHVSKTLGQSRPAYNGTIYIYGTRNPSPSDTLFGVHRQWNIEGTGGDKRGKLIATRPYDDGRCFQVLDNFPISIARQQSTQWGNPPIASDLPCQNDIQLPEDAGTSGTYTLYWVWDYTLLPPGAAPAPELYSSCIDITMTSKAAPAFAKFSAKTVGKDVLNAAIPNQIGVQFMMDPTAPVQVAEVAYTYKGSSPSAAPKPASSPAPSPAPSPSPKPAPGQGSASGNGAAISELPACGQTCFNNMIAQGPQLNCPASDPACLCKAQNFGYGIRDCALQSCGAEVGAQVIAFKEKWCGGASAVNSRHAEESAIPTTVNAVQGFVTVTVTKSAKSVETIYITSGVVVQPSTATVVPVQATNSASSASASPKPFLDGNAKIIAPPDVTSTAGSPSATPASAPNLADIGSKIDVVGSLFGRDNRAGAAKPGLGVRNALPHGFRFRV